MNKPLISIITASYNSDKFIQRCIDSVENQTYANVEHIIIDGNSTDCTVDIIKQSADKESSNISYWVSESDGGVYYAFNKGLKQVNGDWVYFLGSDDVLFDDNVFEKVSQELIKVPEDTYFAYGGVDKVDDNGSVILQEGYEAWDVVKLKILDKGQQILPGSHQGMFCRKEAYDEWGSFDTTFNILGDGEHFQRVINDSKKAYFIDFKIAKMQMGGLSANIKSWKQITREIKITNDRYDVPKLKLYKILAMITFPIKMVVFSLPEFIIALFADTSRVLTGRNAIWLKYIKNN